MKTDPREKGRCAHRDVSIRSSMDLAQRDDAYHRRALDCSSGAQRQCGVAR